ncbi:MAG: sigma-70 family RNA polymerase sigma factor [Roseibacillus sp.]
MKIDLSKFVALLIEHQEIIRSYIITQIPGSPDVRDVLQEVNIVLWEKRGSFKEGTNFGAWACTVARYKVLEHRRKDARRNNVLIFKDELAELFGEKALNRPSDFQEDRRQALEHCLSKMSPNNRQLLTIRYATKQGGLEQLTKDTGRSNDSLRVTLFRLRESLRNCIQSHLLSGGKTS